MKRRTGLDYTTQLLLLLLDSDAPVQPRPPVL